MDESTLTVPMHLDRQFNIPPRALFYFTMYNGLYPVNTGTYKTLSVLVDRVGLIDLIKQTWIRHLHFVLA